MTWRCAKCSRQHFGAVGVCDIVGCGGIVVGEPLRMVGRMLARIDKEHDKIRRKMIKALEWLS